MFERISSSTEKTVILVCMTGKQAPEGPECAQEITDYLCECVCVFVSGRVFIIFPSCH